MANAKSKTKKPAPKKVAKKTVKKPAVKKEVIIYKASDVELTKTQKGQVDRIISNEDKIGKQKLAMVDIAIDSGTRLNLLKEGIQKKYPKTWKAWAETNLPIGYPQITRYMKVAKNQNLLEGKTYSSLEDAVKLISFDGDETAMAESGTSKKDKRETASAAKVAFTPAALMEAIDSIDKVETLQMLRDYIQSRIDSLGAIEVDLPEGDEDGEVDEDAADAIAELSEANG